VFGAILAVAALSRRRVVLALAFADYALLAAMMSTAEGPVARFILPPVFLVAGYWLTAPFYRSPSPRLEAWLMRYDDALGVDRWRPTAPGWIKAAAEVAYQGCYPFMLLAAVPPFLVSRDAFGWHWTLVLTAELACYVTLPWLQARPPREIRAAHDGALRRVNQAFMDRLSVRATTIPSGHVAGPIAATLSVLMVAPQWGPWLLACALMIAAATVIGRYHYAVDALLGLAAGILPPAIRAFWP
jgi:hypothetical protein